MGPDRNDVQALMAEVVSWLEESDLDVHPVVRAAMAHLHVVSVHPFRDGNGRISRVLQSLALAREGLVSPEFGWIAHSPKAPHTREARDPSRRDPRHASPGPPMPQ